MRTVLRYIIWIIAGLIIGLLLLPFVYKDRFVEEVKNYINQNVNATVDFKSAHLSFIKSFPDAYLELKDLSIKGIDQFKDQELLTSDNLSIDVNISSLFKDKPIEINEVNFSNPKLAIVINRLGESNLDIFKNEESERKNVSISGHLESYIIENGKLNYIDSTSNTLIELSGIDHSGVGDFSLSNFNLDTKSTIDTINYKYDGISYLKDAKLNGQMNVLIDLDKARYELRENNITINALQLATNGYVQLNDENIDVDLHIKAPKNDFKEIFSIIPNVYSNDFNRFDINGGADLDLKVKGKYNTKSYPALRLALNTKNARVFDATTKTVIENLNLDLNLIGSKSDWSDLALNIAEFSFEYLENPFYGNLLINKLTGNYQIKTLMKGKVDLRIIDRFFNNPDLKNLNGLANLDLLINTGKNQNIDRSDFKGFAIIDGLGFQYAKYAPVQIDNCNINLSPTMATFTFDNVSFGNSQMNLSGNLIEPINILNSKNTRGEIAINAEVIDYNEFEVASIKNTSVYPTTNDSLSESIIKNVQLTYLVKSKVVNYGDYEFNDLNIKGKINSDELTINNGSLLHLNNPVRFNGDFSNVYNYGFNDQELLGNVSVASPYLDLNETNQKNNTSNTDDIFLIPENMELTINSKIDKLKFRTYTLNDINGTFKVKNAIAAFKDIRMNGLGGKMILDGFYDSSDITEPRFAFDYKLDNIKFSELYSSSESFKVLAPIAKYLEGRLNSTLSMAGPLDQQMSPILNKVTAAGFLETLDAKIDGFLPLDELNDKLGLSSIKNLVIENTKNWFEIENGAVLLKPRLVNFDGMGFNFGGKHFIDQQIDYFIKASIPRDKLKKNQVSNLAESGLNLIEKEAAKRKVNIDLGDMIYLDVFLTGTINKPSVKIIPTGAGGKSINDIVKDEITNQKEIIKKEVKKEVDKKINVLKDTVTKKANEKIDTLNNKIKIKLKKEVEIGKTKAQEKIDDVIKTKIDSSISKPILDTLTKKAEDVLGDEAKEKVDKLKSKLKDLFDKKKGN